MNALQLKDNGRSGTLKHRLVHYVTKYSKNIFYVYTLKVVNELKEGKSDIKKNILKK